MMMAQFHTYIKKRKMLQQCYNNFNVCTFLNVEHFKLRLCVVRMSARKKRGNCEKTEGGRMSDNIQVHYALC